MLGKLFQMLFFKKYGGLNFLLKCNYNTKKLDKSVSLFYLEMLDYFKELRQVNQDSYKSDLILWNNQDITIEGKSLFWKRWTENGIYYIQDILNENGNFLTFEEFNRRYNMSTNFLNFFQILASIPPNLKSKVPSTLRAKNSVLDNSDWKMGFSLQNEMQRLLPSVPRKIRGYTYSCQVLGPTLLWHRR